MQTASATSDASVTEHPHGVARYRRTQHGVVVLIPTRCRNNRHVLTIASCRILETGDTLRVRCVECEQLGLDSDWALTTAGRRTTSAEFDDGPYAELLHALIERR